MWFNYVYDIFLSQSFSFYAVKCIYIFLCNLRFLCPVYEIFHPPTSLRYSPIFFSKIFLKFCFSYLFLIHLELIKFDVKEESNFSFQIVSTFIGLFFPQNFAMLSLT